MRGHRDRRAAFDELGPGQYDVERDASRVRGLRPGVRRQGDRNGHQTRAPRLETASRAPADAYPPFETIEVNAHALDDPRLGGQLRSSCWTRTSRRSSPARRCGVRWAPAIFALIAATPRTIRSPRASPRAPPQSREGVKMFSTTCGGERSRDRRGLLGRAMQALKVPGLRSSG
jgi:hypothetical protein